MPPRYGLALALLGLTFVTMTTLGAAWYLATRVPDSALSPWLSPATIRGVWRKPELLRIGLSFSVPTLVILLAHELGHYIVARRYRLPATLPYFLPAPLGLGTFGAFIRIRGAIRSKRQLFDVGIAGPIAGFIVLLPFLVYGLAHSEVRPLDGGAPETATRNLIAPGNSLLMRIIWGLGDGPSLDQSVLQLHPFALAAWVGLLATSLNLLPLGQLDGGHILYSVLGKWQRRIAWPLFGVLALVGFFFWKGWLLWALISLLVGLRHPRVLDEAAPLGRSRRVLAVVALLIFVLSFMPVPAYIIAVR